jgi:beta-N-acetylhexosaminidase
VPPNLELAELNTHIGRLFVSGIPGTKVDQDTEMLIREYCIGGIILFARNIADPIQLATLCSDLQELSMDAHGIPLFLAVDQEGGRVARLREPFTRFPGNTAIGESPDPLKQAEIFAETTAREMALVGLNMNLAPVLDVPRGEPEKHLIGRTFSDRPEVVARLGRSVIEVLQKRRVMAVAKHFPGLGRTSVDPHHLLPTIDLAEDEMETHNLPPFGEAITANVAGIMTSHAIYPVYEPDQPATLSANIVTDLLRTRLGFKGLILTDDLEMGAIKKKWGVPLGAVEAFKAGSDLLLICKDQQAVLESMLLLRKKILKQEIPAKRLLASVERIMAAKDTFLRQPEKAALNEVEDYFKA